MSFKNCLPLETDLPFYQQYYKTKIVTKICKSDIFLLKEKKEYRAKDTHNVLRK